jgi:hypothetical protein
MEKGLVYFSSARLVLEWTFQQFIERELARTCSRASTTSHKESNRVTGSRSLFVVHSHPLPSIASHNGRQNRPADALLGSSVLSV